MSPFQALEDLVATLRSPTGCPWDQEQTPRSLRPYLIEEAHEVIHAIDSGDSDALRDELGDLLFQVLLLAEIAKEMGSFDIDDVCTGIREKMIERHPHVFDPDHKPEADPGSIAAWEARKAQKRPKNQSMLDGLPASLPALLTAHRVGEKVSRVGFDWPDIAGVRSKFAEETAVLDEAIAENDSSAIAHEYGDLLLSMANLGRFLGVAPEDCLREANARFASRFRTVENLAKESDDSLHEMTLEELESLWDKAKELE
ncbi:MAG: nucleoside triphosphate pyrophosphohydrolase [Myxococcota bacterium]|nr:nucleoside triphosphate pyrophosphohydrolase [Myxococcota bacterium]